VPDADHVSGAALTIKAPVDGYLRALREYRLVPYLPEHTRRKTDRRPPS